MNKQILIALALASIFISANAAVAQITCYGPSGTADANCASCPSSAWGVCTTCKAGYFVSGAAASNAAVCTACATGCATCTSATATTCSVAMSGYYLTANPGTATANAACATGCTTCAAGGCTAAANGYFLAANPGTPATCSGTTSATAYTCNVCTAATAGTCTTAASGYFLAANPGTPAACSGTTSNTVFTCSVCTAVTAGTCTTAANGYFLAANPGTPATCSGTTSNTVYACQVCTAATATTCTTAGTGYFLLGGSPGTATACTDTLNAAACTTAAATVSGTCTFGTKDTASICCGQQNCATCSAIGSVTNANNVCATCSTGYTLANGACNCVANCLTCTSATACTTCMSGYTATGTSPAITACVASTPVPTTDSPATSAFNVTPTAVFLSTETSTPAFTGVATSSGGPANGVIYGGGFDDSTAYVWELVVPSLTGVVSVNRRTLNATYGGSLAKLNSSADVAITTAIPYSASTMLAVGAGYLGIASYVSPTNWNGVGGTATAGDVSLTYIAVNGTSATTKSVAGNTAVNSYFQVNNIWYDTGVFYVIYTMFTHTPGTATPTADTYTANGIYINGISVSTGATIYNGTTGGIKAIALTASNTGSVTGLSCTGGCASQPNVVAAFLVAGNNRTNSSLVNYVWEDRSASTNLGVIKTGTITLATGAGTAGTVLQSEAVPTGASTVVSPLITTMYSAGGALGSFGTSGVFVNKKVITDTGAGSTATNPSTVYSTLAYINGSSTAAGNVTIVSGYQAPIIQGYGTSDGYVLVEKHTATTTPTSGQRILIQVERFFTNGSTNGAATSLGTYHYLDAPNFFQDTNGSIYLGYTTTDTLTSKTYAGMLGKYLAQSLASGASTLTSIFAFLSLMIVALFTF